MTIFPMNQSFKPELYAGTSSARARFVRASAARWPREIFEIGI
jgi:hypothetical protein